MRGLDIISSALGLFVGFSGVWVVYYVFNFLEFRNTYIQIIFMGLFVYFYWEQYYKKQKSIYFKNSLVVGVVVSVIYLYLLPNFNS